MAAASGAVTAEVRPAPKRPTASDHSAPAAESIAEDRRQPLVFQPTAERAADDQHAERDQSARRRWPAPAPSASRRDRDPGPAPNRERGCTAPPSYPPDRGRESSIPAGMRGSRRPASSAAEIGAQADRRDQKGHAHHRDQRAQAAGDPTRVAGGQEGRRDQRRTRSSPTPERHRPPAGDRPPRRAGCPPRRRRNRAPRPAARTAGTQRRPRSKLENRIRMASPSSLPVSTVIRPDASCSTRQATVEKSSAQARAKPKSLPARAAVVTVPGPMNAAAITDQNSRFRSRFTRPASRSRRRPASRAPGGRR